MIELAEEGPTFIAPMQCKPVKCLPSGEQWRYELKLDGYRALAIKPATSIQLLSRNRNDLSRQFPEIVNALELLPLREGVVDGEILAVDALGKPSFQALQHLARPGRKPRRILYFAFDLLNWEGKSLLKLSLVERKRLLELALAGAPAQVRLLGFLDGEPDAIVDEVRRQHLEGVVAKRALSQYEPDQRSGSWVKFKCGLAQEFVIGGYTRGRGGAPFGALIVGFYDGGRLRYAAKVGSGFNHALVRDLVVGTGPIRQAHSPFDFIPQSDSSSWSYGLTALERKMAVWLQPVLVCRVRFMEWTNNGHVRHPCFEGIRTDKAAHDVVRES